MPQSVVLDDSPSYRPPRESPRKHPLATMTDTPLTPELSPSTHPSHPIKFSQQSSGRAIVRFEHSSLTTCASATSYSTAAERCGGLTTDE
jgi:hypothetical protein